jgi:hypothetical protein
MSKFSPLFYFISCAILSSVSLAQDSSIQEIQAGSYEECAVRVFEESTKVSDVFKECEAEMNAYLSRYDAKKKEKVKVETRRALTEKTLPQVSDEG